MTKPKCQKAKIFISLVIGRYSWSEDTISSSDLLSSWDSGTSLSPGLTAQEPVAGVVGSIALISSVALVDACDDDSHSFLEILWIDPMV